VPVYNPAAGWEQKLQLRFDEFCEAIGISFQLFLINDGSTVDLSEGVRYLETKYSTNFKYLFYSQNLGKGGALKFGASHGNTSKYMFTDIDFPYDTKSMVKVWETSCTTSGIIIGHRDESYYDDMTNIRIVLSKGLRWLNRIILKLPVNDTQCGLKAFDNQAKDLLLSCVTDRFLIDLEFLLAAKKSNIQITPVSVHLRKETDFTSFNSSVLLKETLSFIKLVLRYRI
jgi:glycosyltransferase involved in cell wall biosynthesis